MPFIIILEKMPLIKRVNKADDIVFQYWQRIDWTSYPWCYMVSILVWASTLKNVQLSMDKYKEFLKYWVDNWKSMSWWWNKSSWLKFVVPWWNDNFASYKIRVVEVKTFTSAFRIAINQWYPVVVSIRVSEKFAQDREDWILDMANYKWTWKKIWHAICIQKIWDDI